MECHAIKALHALEARGGKPAAAPARRAALHVPPVLSAEPPAGAADPLAAVKAELSTEVALLAPRFAHALPKVAMPGDKAPAFTAANFVGKIIEYTQAFVGADGKVAAKYRWVHSFAPAPTTLQQFGAAT